MPKLILKGYILVPETDLLQVLNELPKHIDLTRNESGCLAFEICQDHNNKNRFNVYEAFSNKAAFSAHQNRVHNSKWGKITRNVERHYQIEDTDCEI